MQCCMAAVPLLLLEASSERGDMVGSPLSMLSPLAVLGCQSAVPLHVVARTQASLLSAGSARRGAACLAARPRAAAHKPSCFACCSEHLLADPLALQPVPAATAQGSQGGWHHLALPPPPGSQVLPAQARHFGLDCLALLSSASHSHKAESCQATTC